MPTPGQAENEVKVVTDATHVTYQQAKKDVANQQAKEHVTDQQATKAY